MEGGITNFGELWYLLFLIYKINIVINLLFYNFIGIIFISINKIYIFKIKNTLKFNIIMINLLIK
jgi:hypothetical protein